MAGGGEAGLRGDCSVVGAADGGDN